MKKYRCLSCMLPIETADQVMAIADSRRSPGDARSLVAPVLREFFAECWGPYLDAHPKLKAAIEPGDPVETNKGQIAEAT